MEVKRATFEKVNQAQIELIFDHIDILEEKKETISKETRRVFFELFAVATLGKAKDYNYILHWDNKKDDLGPLSIFARQMAYMEPTSDGKQEITFRGKKVFVPVEYLWETLRTSLYKPMDEALTLALRSSAEILRSGSEGYAFRPEDEIE